VSPIRQPALPGWRARPTVRLDLPHILADEPSRCPAGAQDARTAANKDAV